MSWMPISLRCEISAVPRKPELLHATADSLLRELDEHTRCRGGMEKGDPLAFGANSWRRVDESNARSATALERRVEIVDGEADVMQPRPAFFDKLRDRRIGRFRFEQFNERVAGEKSGNVSAVGIFQRRLLEAKDIAVER